MAASRALKIIFGFRKWIGSVELILYILMFVTLITTAYHKLMGGGH